MTLFGNQKGITLIELMVAISIVAILATIGVAILSRTQINARDTKRKEDLASIRQAFVLLAQDNGGRYCTPTLPAGTYYSVNNPIVSNLSPRYMGAVPFDQLTPGAVNPNYFININAECTGVVFSARLEGNPGVNLPCTTPGGAYNYCIAL